MIRTFIVLALSFIWAGASGQITNGTFSGNIQSDFQYYQNDEKLGITDSALSGKRTGLNAYANFLYSSINLEAGVRYEMFHPPITGFDARYKGRGIAHKYIRYHNNMLDITVGNYYEQFGNGMIFRAYNDWSLGYDNAMDGLRIKVRPMKGLYLKFISGVQRFYWDSWSKDDDRGIVSGMDAEINMNELLSFFEGKKTHVIFGASFITKHQKDNHPLYKIPKDVAAFAGRMNVSYNHISVIGEYAYKINDPSADNGMIYKPGEALFVQASYARKGFSFAIGGKRLDNMSFRSDRNAGLNDLMINYLPALNKQHIYALPADLPYATQANGELGFTVMTGYKIRKGTVLGGKYGTDLSLSLSRITDIRREALDSFPIIGQAGTEGYHSGFFREGDEYFEDLSVELQKRLTKNLKMTFMYGWVLYNIAVIEGHPGEENVQANYLVGDLTWRVTQRQAIRFETQHLSTKQHDGSWAAGGVEYTNKGFFASAQDLWNYGNPDEAMKIHYLMISAGYSRKATRIAIGYGRQKEGIICIGGVCRFVPAINGLSVSFATSF